MKVQRITFIIFTFNEAHRIEYPIRCYLPYGDVLIIDNCSTDDTCEIANKLGAKVIRWSHSYIPVENKEDAEYIFQYVNTEWVYWGFADEMIPLDCLQLYSEITAKSTHKIVVQKLKTMLYSSEMEFLPTFASIKLFRIGAIDFSPKGENIHGIGRLSQHVKAEEILFLPPIDELSVQHFSVYTTEKLINNHNIYSTVHAKLISKKFIRIKLVILPLINFFNIYLVQRSCKHGILGFIVAVEYSYYFFQIYAKAYENHNKISLASIEEKFKARKESLLKQSPKSSLIVKTLATFKKLIFSKLYLYKHLRKNIKK